AGAASAALIGVSWAFDKTSTTVWSIDPDTGATTPIGVSHAQGLNSLARRSDGMLVSVATFLLPAPVVQIHPESGYAQTIVNPNFGGVDPLVTALAFSRNDTLYAIVNLYPPSQDRLYTLDLDTGLGTLVASFPGRSIQGLDFGPDGFLYAWDIVDGLLRIDPATWTVVDVSQRYSGAAADIQSLAFDGS